MSKPTIVRLEHGTSANGYTFVATNYQNLIFTCWYDGRDVEVQIPLQGMKVSNVLNMLYGLFHKDSNFKKRLLIEYSYLTGGNVNRIYFRNLTNYQFVITKDSDVDKLMREYYRSFNFVVEENDSEEEIWNRRERIFKKRFGIEE